MDKIRLIPAAEAHATFVESLSAAVFSRFGDYASVLPQWLSQPGIHTRIADAGGTAVGFAMYAATLRQADELTLRAIAVVPAWQSRGIGRKLLQYVESVAAGNAASDGRTYVRVTVAEDNPKARKLFELSGYETLPGREGVYPAGQRSLDMRKKIGACDR
jgi:ribosomal protein S18 acetylase RimI-like enzyme